MIYSQALTPKPDFLTVTYSDSDFNPRSLELFLAANFARKDDVTYMAGEGTSMQGTIRYAKTRGRHSVSAGGGALDFLRVSSLESEFLGVLTDNPCKVTRLDLALDMQTDMARLMPRMMKKFGSGVQLRSRGKLLTPRRFDRRREDGKRSGTLYLGGGADALSLKVYDKTLERLDRAGIQLDRNYTRYEFRFGRDYGGVTLADYTDPDPLFWKHAAQFLRKPAGVADWVPREFLRPKVKADNRTGHERLEARAYDGGVEGFFLAADKLGVSRSDALSVLGRIYANVDEMAADGV